MLDKKALTVLFGALFLAMLGVGIIIPNIAYHAADHAASPLQISLLFTVYSLMQFIFAPVWGHLSDRHGRKPILLLGLLGSGISLIAFGLADHLWLLFLARALAGLMSSAVLPTAMAYVADVTDESGRGRGMGLMGAAMGLGFIFGPGIGGLLARFGHDTPFFVSGALSLLNCAMAAFALRESNAPQEAVTKSRMAAPWRAFQSPLLPFYWVAFCVPFAMAALETTFPLFIQDRFGYGAFEMGWMFLFMGTAVALVQGVLLGRLIQRYGEERVLRFGLMVNAAGFLMVIAAGGWKSLTAALLVAGVGNQVMRPTNASLISKRTAHGQGVSIGMMDSFDSLGRIIGPLLAGSLYGGSAVSPYLAAAAMLLLCRLTLWSSPSRSAAGARGAAPPAGP
jgi:multidrug resistance protein